MIPPPPIFYTPAELAVRWRVSRDTVYRQMASGKLRHIRIGGQRRVSAAEVERYESGGKRRTLKSDWNQSHQRGRALLAE